MDFDPSTNLLYVATYGSGDLFGSQMYVVDVAAPSLTPIGQIAGDISTEMVALSIAVPSSPCSLPADMAWLAITPLSGTVAPASSADVTVTFDANGLADGVYTANLCLRSNDPRRGYVITVPVTFTVGGGADAIFADGFDQVPLNPNVVHSGPLDYVAKDVASGTSFNWITGEICTDRCDFGPHQFRLYANPYETGAGPLRVLLFGWPDDIGIGDSGGGIEQPAVGDFYYVPLQSGATIGPASPFATFVTPSSMPPVWQIGVDGYLGFRFDCSSLGGPSPVCYGYVHLITATPDGTTLPSGYPIRVVEYAYDKAGKAITIP
jgi:hypothetical protein